MGYSDHFKLADDYITHLDTVIRTIPDPFIISRYTGFLAVSAVTVYELAIKTIFIEFAEKKHKVLGNFTVAYFDKINGRIKSRDLKERYIAKFGDKYIKRFKKKIEKKEKQILRAEGASISASYGNVITWRNEFVHEGKSPSTATYEEVKQSYARGKYLINCLAEAMNR